MKAAALALLVALSLPVLAEEAPFIKPAPTRPPEGSSIRIVDMEVLPDCAENKVCADGTIENNGMKTAYLVRLKVELGGTKFGKPRTYFVQQLSDNEMAPGEKQDFSLMIDRKFAYKDPEAKERILEVGRYNFKVVPVWAAAPAAPRSPQKGTKN